MKHYIASRNNQAIKINAILEDYFGSSDLRHFSCLEVGCGSGEITAFFANIVSDIWGIEIDRHAIIKSPRSKHNNLAFSQADGAKLPFKDSFFDLVLFPQVYEHTTNQQGVIDEIYRVLKTGGVCFFSGPNRFQIIEPHYFLPFLSWLPHRWASLYLRITKRGEVFDIYPRSYYVIKKLTKAFTRHDYTHKLIMNPQYYGISDRVGKFRLHKMPSWLLKLMSPIYPNYNWILVKDNE